MVRTSGFANGDPVNHIIGTGANNLSIFKVFLDWLSSDESIQWLFHITRYPDLMEVYGWHTNGGLISASNQIQIGKRLNYSYMYYWL